jgi:hypothetical protein
MRLRGIEFGNVLGASGVQGFYGEGYKFHRWLGPLGPTFNGMTFVSKTTTLSPTPGNMPLGEDFEPTRLLPSCIWVDPLQGIALNAVGLSGPGAHGLLSHAGGSEASMRRMWQLRTEPFFISYMSTAPKRDGRLTEMEGFVKIFKSFLRGFTAPVGLQINLTCGNVGLDLDVVIAEASLMLDIAAELNVPLMPKINLTVSPQAAIEVAKHPACDALCTTNAIAFEKMGDDIDWKLLFPKGSPLKQFGGGALSGRLLFPLVAHWTAEAIEGGFSKPLNIGGGIMQKADISELVNECGLRPGTDSIFLGTVAMTRPWRVQSLIDHGNNVLSIENHD